MTFGEVLFEKPKKSTESDSEQRGKGWEGVFFSAFLGGLFVFFNGFLDSLGTKMQFLLVFGELLG